MLGFFYQVSVAFIRPISAEVFCPSPLAITIRHRKTGFNELGFENLYLCCVDAAQMYRIFQSSRKNIGWMDC
jgi:hypothetical protein